MCATFASELLRPGLLQGVSILLAPATAARAQHPPGGTLGAHVQAACVELGASVSSLEVIADGAAGVEQDAIDRALERTLARTSRIELLVVDGAALFAAALSSAGGEGARAALRACLDVSWNLTRAVAERAFLASDRGGRIVLLAPASDAGEHADAARAGLENLARTLSVEWARYRITVVAVVCSSVASAGEVAALTAYLASPAGAYFSGCLLALGGSGGG